jgi:hypothetical protein
MFERPATAVVVPEVRLLAVDSNATLLPSPFVEGFMLTPFTPAPDGDTVISVVVPP